MTVNFFLILTLTFPGQPSDTRAVALMIDKASCTVAAAGMIAVLEQANPGLTVTAECRAEGEAE